MTGRPNPLGVESGFDGRILGLLLRRIRTQTIVHEPYPGAHAGSQITIRSRLCRQSEGVRWRAEVTATPDADGKPPANGAR